MYSYAPSGTPIAMVVRKAIDDPDDGPEYAGTAAGMPVSYDGVKMSEVYIGADNSGG